MTELRTRALHGTFWAYIQNWSARGLTLIIFFILARLLGPAEFGTFAIATVFLSLAEVFVEQGLGHGIVQRQDLCEKHRSTAFWTTLMMGIVIAVVSCFVANPVSKYFGHADIGPMIMVLSPVFIFMALASVPAALLRRELQYKVLAKRSVLANFTSGIVAIGLAANGFGVWTFVGQQLVFHFVGVVVLWKNESWRPHFNLSKPHFLQLGNFSSKIILVKLLDFVETRVVDMLVGHQLGLLTLGNYSLATRANQALTQLIAAPMWDAANSILSRYQEDRIGFIETLHAMSNSSSYFAFPAFIFIAIFASPIVNMVFGTHWVGSIETLSLLAIISLIRVPVYICGIAIQALGKANLSMWFAIMRIMSIFVFLFLLPNWGLIKFPISILLAQLIVSPFTLIFYARLAGDKMPKFLLTFWRPFWTSIVSGITTYAVGLLFDERTLLDLVVSGIFFSIIYLLLNYSFYLSILYKLTKIFSKNDVLIDYREYVHLVGSFGEKNLGDDLLLTAMIRKINQVSKKIKISIAVTDVNDAGYVHKFFPNAHIQGRYKTTSMKWKAIIYSGGTQFFSLPKEDVGSGRTGLFKNIYSKIREEGFLKFLLRHYLKRFGHNPPQFAIGIGVGPFLSGNMQASRKALSLMKKIWLRDEESQYYLSKWRLENYFEGADICFGSDFIVNIQQQSTPATPKSIGVIIRGWEYSSVGKEYKESLMSVCRSLEAKGYKIYLFSFCEKIDRLHISYFQNYFGNVDVWNPDSENIETYVNRLSRCDFFISCRFHGVVLAAIFGRPAIGIELDPKVRQICKKLGQENYVCTGPFSDDALIKKVDRLIGEYPYACKKISEAVNEERLIADRMFEDVLYDIK